MWWIVVMMTTRPRVLRKYLLHYTLCYLCAFRMVSIFRCSVGSKLSLHIFLLLYQV